MFPFGTLGAGQAAKAWDAFAKSKEGREFIKREGATLEKLMEESGASVAGRYAAAKLDATVFEAVREAYEEGSSITRAAEVLEEYAKEQNELDHPAAPDEAEKIAAQDSPTGEDITPEAQEDAPPVDEETGDFEAPEGTEKEQGDRGAGLVNGMYAEAGDGSVYGVARVEDLSISADVPQFKKKEVAGQREAANEDGTTHELSGGWNAKSAPIIVWRRRDGRLEVISGRHRLAHAKKNGVGHIAVRVYDEDAAHDAAWAKLYDVEVNILEGMCGAIDVAFYFRHNPMSIAEAEARGLMPKTQAGGQTAASRMGIMIATRASGYVFDSLVNGGVSAEDAYMACVITESAEGQELALKARRGTKGKKRSWEYVTALVRGAEQMAPEGGGSLTDLFGFDEGFAKRAEKMANYVEAVRKQLRRRIDVLSGAGSLQRKGEMTREMGVKIDRPEDAVKIIERLAKLDAAYEAMDPGLGIVEAAEAWDGKSEPDLRLTIDDLRFGDERASRGEGSFSVIGEHARTWGKYKERAFAGRDDGRMRAEIDASQARVTDRAKMLLFWPDHFARWVAEVRGAGADKELRKAYREATRGRKYDAEAVELVGRELVENAPADIRDFVQWEREYENVAKAVYEAETLERVSAMDEVKRKYKVTGSSEKLGDVLDYPELYEAYPQLRDYVVAVCALRGNARGEFYRALEMIQLSIELRNEQEVRSTLLHEVQHAIQGIEGFARGGYESEAARLARERGMEREGLSEYDYYLRMAGEIEARNVQARKDMTAGERLERAFNETLEYPGEAIVDFSASVAMWKGTLGALRGNFPARGTEDYVKDILVCPTPAVMRMVGARALDTVITPAVIEKVTVGKHGVSYAELEQLPEALADPVCIAVSDTPNALEVITELVESTANGDRNILVAVHLDVLGSGSRGMRVNRIASLYGKEKIAKLLTHPMLYWNQTKASTWTGRPGLQLPSTPYPVKAYDRRIREPRDLVKYKMRHGLSFSVRGDGLLDRVNLREMAEEEKMSRLMRRARSGAARWRRVFMDDKTSAAEAARALGEVSSVMEAVYMYLPAGERPVYAGKMRLVEAYARLVETGRVWHRENAKSEGARAKQEVLDEVMAELEKVSTVKGEALREVREGYVREVAGRKLSEVAVSMVEDAVDAVERHLVRKEMDVVRRMAEALKPKKLKSGKLAPGKMSAEGYRRFAKYMKMVEMSAAEKAERMEELAGKLDKESEAEKQEPIEEEMRELAMFGALGSGRLAEARRGVRELVGFVRAERTSWEGRVELEKEQMRHFARVAVEAMGGVDRNKLAARRDRAKKPLRTILGTQKGFMSLGQMWMAMQGVPALRGLAEWSLERLARGNVALGMRERALREAEVAFMAQELGLTSEAARNDFLVDLKRERATGVRKAGEKRVHKVRVTIEEAREIVAMNF